MSIAVSFKLGLTSFGGPVAHLGATPRVRRRRQYRREDVHRSGRALPVPAEARQQSGQFSIGLMRAGWIGGLAAWCGFAASIDLLLIGFAVIAPDLNGPIEQGLIHAQAHRRRGAVHRSAVWDFFNETLAHETGGEQALRAHRCRDSFVSPTSRNCW